MFDMTQCLNPAILVEGCLTPKACVNRCPDESYCLPINMHKENETKKENAENNLTGRFFKNDLTEVKDGIPEKDLEKGLHRFGTFLAVRQFGERVFSDFKATYWMVGLALMGACVISFIWILLMRFLAGVMVYTS